MTELLTDRRRLLPLLLTAIVIAVGAFLIVVLAGDDDGGGAAASAPAPAGATKVDIKNFDFMPATIDVKAGSKVTWTNDDTAPHTATADGPGAGFDTGTLNKGQSKTLTIKAGTYDYICTIHPFMKAKLVAK